LRGPGIAILAVNDRNLFDVSADVFDIAAQFIFVGVAGIGID